MKRTFPFSTLVVVAAIASARDARAEAADLEITWDAPPGCPSTDDVRARVARLRATGGSTAAPRPVRVRGRITGEGASFRLDLSLATDQAATDRVIEASACTELADATALLVVLASDADAEVRAEPTSAASTSTASSRPASDRSASPDGTPSPPPSDPPPPAVRLAIRLFASTDVASLPAPAIGGGAAAALDVGPARAELVGTWLAAREGRVVGRAAGADVSLVVVTPRGCWVPHRGTVELGGCLGVALGSTRAEAFGVSDPDVGSALWLAPHLGLLAAVTVAPPVRLVAGAEAAVPLARERFLLVGVGEVHRPPEVTARAMIGVELRP